MPLTSPIKLTFQQVQSTRSEYAIDAGLSPSHLWGSVGRGAARDASLPGWGGAFGMPDNQTEIGCQVHPTEEKSPNFFPTLSTSCDTSPIFRPERMAGADGALAGGRR